MHRSRSSIPFVLVAALAPAACVSSVPDAAPTARAESTGGDLVAATAAATVETSTSPVVGEAAPSSAPHRRAPSDDPDVVRVHREPRGDLYAIYPDGEVVRLWTKPSDG